MSVGRKIVVKAPANRDVANYLSRMGIAADLPEAAFPDLPYVRKHDQSAVLVPITRLRTPNDVEITGDELYRLFQGHADDEVAVFADALQEAFTELCNNGVEHGENPLGRYLAAQRYRAGSPKTVLTIGDLGVGIPSVLHEAQSARITYAQLEIRSGGASLRHYVNGNGISRTNTSPAGFKQGTWICFELGPPS